MEFKAVLTALMGGRKSKGTGYKDDINFATGRNRRPHKHEGSD